MMTTKTETRDLGITYRDGEYTERTVIATITRDGIEVTGAVLLDADGNVIEPPDAFTVDGVDNWEMAAAVAAEEHDRNSSWCALVGIDLCDAARNA